MFRYGVLLGMGVVLSLSSPALAEEGEVLVSSSFSEAVARCGKGNAIEGWRIGKGEFEVRDGSLVGYELPADNHASSITQRLEASNLVLTAEIRLGNASLLAFACRDNVAPHHHIGRLYVAPSKIWITHMTGIAKTTTSKKLIQEKVELDPERWYPVRIEIMGERYKASVGEFEIEGSHPRFQTEKAIVALVNKGEGAQFRKVEIRRVP